LKVSFNVACDGGDWTGFSFLAALVGAALEI